MTVHRDSLHPREERARFLELRELNKKPQSSAKVNDCL